MVIRAFRASGKPLKPPTHEDHVFKSGEVRASPASLFKLFGRIASASKHPSNVLARGGHSNFLYFQHGGGLRSANWVHRRSYSVAHGPISSAHGPIMRIGSPQKLNDFVSFGRHCWRTAWGKRVLARPTIPVSPIGAVVKAVSLGCAHSHLPFGVLAIVLGGSTVAHAQANALALPSNPSSLALSTVYTFFDLCGLITRSLYLWILFMPAVLTAPFASMFGGFFWRAWLQLVHHTLEFAGAAFIKWGQWAATRPDLFPKDLCTELEKLHSNAPAHKFSYTVKAIERAFGKALHEIFVEFEEKPVASGSIAQVYKATLQDGAAFGKHKGPMTVAVKVRHPGVSDVIRRDFIIINWIVNLSSLMPGLRWLRLDESVRQFAVFMLTQVDLAREAAHLSRFSYNFRSWRDVSFPRPVYPLVHPAVLVESFEQGESVSSYMELSDNSQVSRKLANIGTNTILKMLLVDNFIHADMHPGNVLVRTKQKTEKKKRQKRQRPQLIFLDVGLTAELTQKDRGNLVEFFKAVALRDGKKAAQCALEFSSKQSCPNPTAFIKQLETSFRFWGSREADSIHPGECMQDVLEQVRTHRVNIDGDVCTVMVTMMVLEGWQRKLDPNFNMMRTLQKLLIKQDMAESLAYTINAVMAP
ncbi:hypothetical protein L7F22_043133 [Adiantum nelumboides]|nr:hypothetical protein [Adiantum nelumboides]